MNPQTRVEAHRSYEQGEMAPECHRWNYGPVIGLYRKGER